MTTLTDDQLQAMADEADQAAAAAVPGAEPPAPNQVEVPPDPVEEIYGALELARAGLVGLKPSLEPVLTDAALRRIAKAAVPVMRKHGWSVGGFFEQWGPELALLAACFPVATGVLKVLKAEAEAAAAALPEPKPEVPAAARPTEPVPAPLVQAARF